MSWVGLSPELVWGLLPRFVGVLYVLCFGPLLLQHDVMPGAHDLAPIHVLRKRVLDDFPGVRRFFDQPTLLWLNDSDTMQRAMCVVGTLCGLLAIYGGPLSWYALLLAWPLLLSLEPRGLLFPWDTMLLEMGFLALFLPTSEPLPSLAASALPLPSVAFMVRWLVLRLMLGFGKDKFLQITKSDFLFMRGFFVWMPLPSPLGWFAHHAPAWVLRFGLLFMFIAEVIAPVLGLFAGPLRIVSFALLVSLMAGIQLTGNWGYFNVGYSLLCVCLLDTQSSIFDLGQEPWASHLSSWPDLGVHLTMGVLFLLSLFYVMNNSHLSRAWVQWRPEIFQVPSDKLPRLNRIHAALYPLRWIAPFRLVNGYGVFPPHSSPPVRLTPVLEGSADGVTWKQYGYRFMPTFAHQRPPIIAPYHARFDQWTYYVTMGMDSGSLFGALFPMANPYTIATRATLFDTIAQRVLANDPKILRHLGHNPFPDAPPKLMRIGLIAMTPTRPSELRATGRWWHVHRVGTLYPARGRESWAERIMIPHPELFHPDLLDWRRRAFPLKAIRQAHERGVDAHQAVLEASDLTAADLTRFWDELVPMVDHARGDWTRVHERAAALQERFGSEGLYRLERVLERYVWLLRGATEPHRYGTRAPHLPTMANYHYHLLLREVVLDGRAAYDAALADPGSIVARHERTSTATQLWSVGMFRYDHLMAHVRCFRSQELGIKGQKNLPSFFEYYDFVSELVPPDETFRFKFIKHEDGEFTVPGFCPPPPLTADAPEAAR